MKTLAPLLFLFIFLANTASAELVVIVNEKNTIDSLSKSEVIDLYMGRHSKLPNGQIVKPIDQLKNSSNKKLFYKQLIKKSLAKVNAYWARLRFTGRARPPKELLDDKSIQEHVKNNINSIGYIDKNFIASGTKPVYYLK